MPQNPVALVVRYGDDLIHEHVSGFEHSPKPLFRHHLTGFEASCIGVLDENDFRKPTAQPEIQQPAKLFPIRREVHNGDIVSNPRSWRFNADINRLMDAKTGKLWGLEILQCAGNPTHCEVIEEMARIGKSDRFGPLMASIESEVSAVTTALKTEYLEA